MITVIMMVVMIKMNLISMGTIRLVRVFVIIPVLITMIMELTIDYGE